MPPNPAVHCLLQRSHVSAPVPPDFITIIAESIFGTDKHEIETSTQRDAFGFAYRDVGLWHL